MKKRVTGIIIILASIIAVVVTLIHIMKTGPSTASTPGGKRKEPDVEVVTASKAFIGRVLELTGTVEPYRVARLASPAEGPIFDIRVREGDKVGIGDELLSVGRKKGIDAMITSLREELKKEENNLERVQQLFETGTVSAEALDQAKATCEKTRAELVQAEEAAEDYRITAPWEGIVSKIFVKEGEYVGPREPLVEMYEPSSLVIQAGVPEKYAVGISTAAEVHIRLDAYPDRTIKGRIVRIYPYLDTRMRTRSIEIALDDSTTILPGMFARLRLLNTGRKEAVVVPVEAVISTMNGDIVYVEKDGRAVGQLVRTGIEESNRVQIINGIQVGDTVIVAGNEKLKDGMPVRPTGGDRPDRDTK